MGNFFDYWSCDWTFDSHSWWCFFKVTRNNSVGGKQSLGLQILDLIKYLNAFIYLFYR